MVYVMGFVAAVPVANKAAYVAQAQKAVPLFARLGVLRQVEAWHDDVPRGSQTDFYRAVAAEEGEAIVYAFHEYPDRETADAANTAMMNDPDMAAMDMPFDMTRMIYGGFESVLERRAEGRTGYVDGSVLAVPEDKRDAYVAAYEPLADLIMRHGALRMVDAWAASVPKGDVTDFPRSVDARADEAVVLSFVEWPDKATRDAAWQALYADPLMQQAGGVFDEKRRIFGGFTPILDAAVAA